jgi:sec-independent protein translocase protein TatB
MFEVGFTEIILILGIALVVLGPEKLPKVAAEIGRWLGRARAMARQLKSQLDEEVVKADREWTSPTPKSRSPRPSAADAATKPAATDATGNASPTDDIAARQTGASGAPASDPAGAPAEPDTQPGTEPKSAP